MHAHNRKRRLPVDHRGQRVPNLYRRPKTANDRREGETFEVGEIVRVLSLVDRASSDICPFE